MVENNKQLKYHAISVMSRVVTRHDGIVEESLCLVFKQSNFPAGFEINPTLLPFKSLLPFNFHDIIQLRTPSTLMIPSLLVASSPPTSETKKCSTTNRDFWGRKCRKRRDHCSSQESPWPLRLYFQCFHICIYSSTPLRGMFSTSYWISPSG